MIFRMTLAIFLYVHGICGNSRQLGPLFVTPVTEIMIFHAKMNQNEAKKGYHLNVFGPMAHHNFHDFQFFKNSKISPPEALCGHQKIKIWTLVVLRGNFNSAF